MSVMVRRFAPSGPLRGSVRPPGDKSITHRALMLGAIAEGRTRVERPLRAGDTRATVEALLALGVRIESVGQESLVVHGVGLHGLEEPGAPLDAGNSGTTVRLLAGLLAGQRGSFTLNGDASLRRRPMDRIVEPLRRMGVEVEARQGRFLPLRMKGGEVGAIRYELPVASAQVKSCVLFAGLHGAGTTTVVERIASRDHSERLLRAAGVTVLQHGNEISLHGGGRLALDEVIVPGDLSSAAFLATAAALVPRSDLRLTGVGLNPTRMGFFTVLRRMGGEVDWEVEGGQDGPSRLVEEEASRHAAEERPAWEAERCDAPGRRCARGGPSGEPWGTLRVRWAPLEGTYVTAAEVPLLIDEVPLVALLATAAHGETLVEGVGELRVKESDRLSALADVLNGLGGKVKMRADAFSVRPSPILGGEVDSHGDHRLALLGAVAGLIARGGVVVHGFEAADVSYPGFEHTLGEVLSS